MSFRCIGIVIVAAVAGAHAQATLPASRWGQATTVLNNTLLIHGGKTDPTNSYSYSSAPNSPELLSLDLSSSFSISNPPWTVLNTTNAPSVAFHTLTPFSAHQLLLFGGDPGPGTAISTQNDSAAILDLATGGIGTWTVPTDGWATEPMRRQYHAATVYNSQIVITGGERVDGSDRGCPDSYLFTPNPSSAPTFSQLPELSSNPAPDFVGHAALALPNGTLLLLGGYSHTSHGLRSLSTVYTLEVASGTWREISTSPEPTPEPTPAPSQEPSPSATPEPTPSETHPSETPPTTDTNSNTNTTPDDAEGIPSRRRNFAAVLVGNDKVLIHGGGDAGLQQAKGDAFVLNLATNQWKELPKLSQALGDRWGHAAVAVGNSVFFVYGYAGNGPASNALVLYDTASDSLLSSFTPSTSTPPGSNTPPAGSGTGGGNGGTNPNPGGSGGGNTSGGSNPSQDSGQDSGSSNKTPAIIGGLFGGLAAAAVVIVVIVLYRRRQEKGRGYGRRAATDDSEKAVMMLGGFEAQPRRGGVFTKLLHLHPTPQQPGRERFDILAEEDASYAAIGNRPRAYRSGTGGSASSYNGGAGGYFTRWSSLGGAVNASVGSFRSALGLAPVPSSGRDHANRDEYLDLGGSTSRREFNSSAGARPPSAWRRGSSYTTANRMDPFGDEHEVEEAGVEEEYQRAMMMQHEAIRRAASSGADEYSALVLDGGRRGAPLETVPSRSTEPSSHSHGEPAGSDARHGRGATSDSTHITSLATPAVNNKMPMPRVYSPPLIQHHPNNDDNGLQRATSGGSRLGASLTRTMSAISDLFSSPRLSSPPPPYGAGNRSRRNTGASKGARSNPGYDYMDLRDPNPPPPMLGLGLIPIEETHNTRRSHEADSAASRFGGPPLVLKAMHGKSLSSLRTANSEALERLGTGHWDVVQRDGTGSSRRTEGSNATLGSASQFTDLGADETRWHDVVGDRDTVESPGGMNEPYEHGPFWNDYAPRSATSPAGPRPIPPPKRVTNTISERIDALGMARHEALPLQGPSDGDALAPRRAQALYGLVPKATLYVANPGKRPTDSSG